MHYCYFHLQAGMLCFTQLNVHVIILLNKSASEKIVSLICLNIINSVMARSFPSLWELLPMHWNRLLFVVIVSSYDDHMMIIWNHYKEEYYQRQCTVVDHYYSFPLWELHTCCFFTLLHHIFILAMAIIGIKIMISTRVETVSCHYRNQQHPH